MRYEFRIVLKYSGEYQAQKFDLERPQDGWLAVGLHHELIGGATRDLYRDIDYPVKEVVETISFGA